MPFRAISIDNGSVFKRRVRDGPRRRGVRLFVLPPRSPKLHCAVERANRTHTEELYEVTTAEPEFEAFQVQFRAWDVVYNTIRPPQALDYLDHCRVSGLDRVQGVTEVLDEYSGSRPAPQPAYTAQRLAISVEAPLLH